MRTVLVRVSVASLLQRFHGCDPEFIRDVCHSACCDAPGRPEGTFIAIHKSEAAAIRARGGVVRKGLLVTPDRVCTFKDDAHLCTLHYTDDKPFGCIASPFTLNRAGCLIVRNRYRFFPCYDRSPVWKEDRDAGIEPPDWPPAYVAFRSSLDLIFGEAESARIVGIIENDFEDRFIPADMPYRSYQILSGNTAIRRDAK